MTKLKAIKDILLGKPLIYKVKFAKAPTIKITENMGIDLLNVDNLVLDLEGREIPKKFHKYIIPSNKFNNCTFGSGEVE